MTIYYLRVFIMIIPMIKNGGRIDLTASRRAVSTHMDPVRRIVRDTAQEARFINAVTGEKLDIPTFYLYDYQINGFWNAPFVTIDLKKDSSVNRDNIAFSPINHMDENCTTKLAYFLWGKNEVFGSAENDVVWTGHRTNLASRIGEHVEIPDSISGIYLSPFGTLSMQLRYRVCPTVDDLLNSAALFGKIYNIGIVQYYWNAPL